MRIEPKSIDDLSPTFREIMEKGADSMGFMPQDGLLLAHCPDILNAVSGLTQAILGKGSVSSGTKRLIGYMTSQSSGCHYCSAHSSHGALSNGISEEQLKEIWEYEQSDLFSDQEKVAIRIAHKAGMHPNSADQTDIDELKKYYSDEEVVEIISTIALYGFFNKFNQTLNTDIEEKPLATYKRISDEQ